ncbi:hypothetical protein AD006_30250 (plasmid) [Pseudonocardia sp. EC080610-09]|uniref:GAF domain-containing protein n=1 Tax=unclassified Pseudonocardia TaxID=2619320 RepID=UPI000705D8DC|nr:MULTISPECIES: GAF domain-containing protein [unclassified Pseudonocardia]ALL79515.1 hypothetical protein AD006_30250 [Pseudonocardia sp. EC080610-09]ALL85533.1 hypothetical protein AD017_31000 [Pseudonocardia sp. EC080619-01]
MGPTDRAAQRMHVLQNDLGEGPCLSALSDHVAYQIDDLRTDERWPRFARRVAAEMPVASIMLPFRLCASHGATGALNLYADEPHAFNLHSRAVSTVLAAHVALRCSPPASTSTPRTSKPLCGPIARSVPRSEF